MSTFSVTPLLLSARIFAAPARVKWALSICVQRIVSYFSIAAQPGDRHANVIAAGRHSISSSELVSYARPYERFHQSLIPAEVC
jgi:hypothetical protein